MAVAYAYNYDICYAIALIFHSFPYDRYFMLRLFKFLYK